MNRDNQLIFEQYQQIQEGFWKDAGKYALGAGVGVAGILAAQHSKHHDAPSIKDHKPAFSQSGFKSSEPSKANMDHPIDSKNNIKQYKVGLMARFHHTETTSGNAKPSGKPTYQYTIYKEIADMYPHYEMVKIYDHDRPVVTIRFSKDGSKITNIIKKPNSNFPEEMKNYIRKQFGITL